MKFLLPIVPTAQARARHGVVAGHSVTFKAPRQRDNEATLDACLLPHRPDKPLEGPVGLYFVAAFPVVRSASKKTREGMLCGKIGHTHKPDLDNLAKQLKDALSRLQFWHDDRQVVALRCQKIWAETGYWKVSLLSLGGDENT